MSIQKFKTMRHIESVRNYLIVCVQNLLLRSALHDQSKLESPEVDVLEEFTPQLRKTVYRSPEYEEILKKIDPCIQHHYSKNPHHPEHHARGIKGMTLLDLLEMLCDWKASTLRNDGGDLVKSIEINQERYGYSDDFKGILINTAKWINDHPPYIEKSHES